MAKAFFLMTMLPISTYRSELPFRRMCPYLRYIGRMNNDIFRTHVSRRTAIRLAACGLAVPAAAAILPSRWLPLASAAAAPRPQKDEGTQNIPAGSVLDPMQLADLLSAPGEKPAIICVGFQFLFTAAHIPGSLYRGPGREGAGIVSLAQWAGNAPKGKTTVLYCGCCPWTQCPNIEPAYVALKQMSFSQVKVLRLNQNFGTDWVDKGYPTEKKKK
jgi:thiosulfate/3-mercaptopyruvate sulfurtransferase